MRKWIMLTAFASLLGGGFAGFLLGHYMGYTNALDVWGGRFVERQLFEAGSGNIYLDAALDSDCDRVAGTARPFVVGNAQSVAWLLPYLEGFDLERARRYLRNSLELLQRHRAPSEDETAVVDFVKRRLAASEGSIRS